MSRLTRLAQAISAYWRSRIQGTAGGHLPPVDPRGYPDQRSGAPPIDPRLARDRRSGAPPIIPPRPPTGNAPTGDDDDGYDEVRLLGRDESYDEQGWEEFKLSMRQVESSNVYAYGFQQESSTMGILYVTFLNWLPKDFGGDGSRSGPGATYAYYDFPIGKYKAFEGMAASSAGGAVWDFCRVRHSVFEHQHTYRLIQTGGDYTPRKATAKGFKSRQPAAIGAGRRNLKGQLANRQLPPRDASFRRQLPKRNYAASPNRGTPNRGTPNRG
ncbi:MAG: hypothetical protein IT422_05040 [Pirellulaceae bacterium]|nr:hypothetical protein [Pirellulaceae bacterium]